MVEDGNPLEELTEVFKLDAEPFIGDPIWWECYAQIDAHRVRDRTSRENRNVKCIFFEILFLIVFAGAFLSDIFLVIQTRPSARLMDIHGTFWNFTENSGNFWTWASSELVEKLYGDSDAALPVVNVGASVVKTYSSNGFTVSSTPLVIPNTDMVLVGSVRFRQLRVQKTQCSDSFNYYNVASFCSSDFATGKNEDTSSFYDSSVPMYLQSAFEFEGDLLGSKISSRNTGISYPSNGFVFDLPPNQADALAALSDLALANWIDVQTSAVIVEVNVYHPISDTFAVDRFLFEYSTANALVSSHHDAFMFPSATAYLTWSISSLSVVLFPIDMLTLLLFCAALSWYLYQFFSVSLPRLCKFVWFYLDTAFVLLFIALVACRSLAYGYMSSVSTEGLFAEPAIFFSISKLANIQSAIWSLQTCLFLLLVLRNLKLLYLIPGSNVLSLAKKSFRDSLALFCVVGFTLIGFTLAYYIQLGYADSAYWSLDEAFTMVGLSLVSVINFKSSDVEFLSFLATWWIFLVYLILIPVFLSIGISHVNVFRKKTGTNALTVWWSIKGKEILVESAESEEGIEDIDLLPGVVKKRILARRRQLRAKVESEFEIEAENYDENDEFVSVDELEKILLQDPFVAEILGVTNAHDAVAKFQKNGEDPVAQALSKKMHLAGNKGVEFGTEMDPSIVQISNELNKMIIESRGIVEKDIAPLIDSVNNLYQTVLAITLSVKNESKRRASKTAFN